MNNSGNLWPCPAQQQLLKAALSDGDYALQVYRTWRKDVDLEGEIGYPVLRLLPLVYHNLLRLGLDDPFMGRLKGVYRRFWCENQTLFFTMQPVLQSLHDGGIDILILKGAPLVLSYYGNHALRPMSDIDIVVPMRQLTEAVDLLKSQGWVFYLDNSEDVHRYFHALQCEKGDLQLDVHFHFLRECVTETADRWFWDDVEPAEFQGMPVVQLGPTALLLHTIVHGVRWNYEPPIRWIPDALLILRQRSADIDWQRLLAFADTQRLTQRLALGLFYLAEHFAAELPDFVMTHLHRYRPVMLERIANTGVLGDFHRMYSHPLTKQWVMFAEYCAICETTNPVKLLLGFSHYLRYRWKLRGRLEIIPAIAKGIARRLGWLS